MAGAPENEGEISFLEQSFSNCVINFLQRICHYYTFPPGSKLPRGYSHQSPRGFSPRIQGFSLLALRTVQAR